MRNLISETFLFNECSLLARMSPQTSGITQNTRQEIKMSGKIAETGNKACSVGDLLFQKSFGTQHSKNYLMDFFLLLSLTRRCL